MLSLDIYDQVVQFISNQISLHNLEEWAISHSEEIARNPNTDDANLLAAIDLALAEYGDGVRDLTSVQLYLRDALREFTIVFADITGEDVKSFTGSSSEFHQYFEAFPSIQPIRNLTEGCVVW